MSYRKQKYFQIPEEIILEKSLGDRRVYTYLYFLVIKRAKSLEVEFCLNSAMEWMQMRQPASKRRYQNEIIHIIRWLIVNGYFQESDETSLFMDTEHPDRSETYRFKMNSKHIFLKNHFGSIWFQDVYKIMDDSTLYKNKGVEPPKSQRQARMLLLLSYLRLKFSISNSSFTYYNRISESIGITPMALSSTTKYLCYANILITSTLQIPSTIWNGKCKGPTVFVDLHKYKIQLSGDVEEDAQYNPSNEIAYCQKQFFRYMLSGTKSKDNH